ncbi:hypothetical protein Q5752_006705 [Cryptotrichosporon argae]
MATSRRDAPLELDSISYWSMFGPPMLGLFIGLLFQGAFSTFAYFRLYPKDPRQTRTLLLMFLTWINTAAGCVRVVRTGISHPGDRAFYYDAAARPEIWAQRLLYGLSVSACQAFMWGRMIIFSRALAQVHGRAMAALSWFIVFGVGGVLLLGVVGTLGLTITLAMIKSYLAIGWDGNTVVGKLKTWYNLQGVTLTTVDFLILTIMLSMIRIARTGFAASETVLDQMTVIVARTGSIAVITQLAQVLTFNLTVSTWGDMTPMFIGQFCAFAVVSILVEPRHVQERFFKKQMEQDEAAGDGRVPVSPRANGAPGPTDGCANCMTHRRLGYPVSTAPYRAAHAGRASVAPSMSASTSSSSPSARERALHGPVSLLGMLQGRHDEPAVDDGASEATKRLARTPTGGGIELPVLLRARESTYTTDQGEPDRAGAPAARTATHRRCRSTDAMSMREMLNSHPFP